MDARAEMGRLSNPPLVAKLRQWRTRRINRNMNRLLPAMANVSIGLNNKFSAYGNVCGLQKTARLEIGNDNVFWKDIRVGAYDRSTVRIGSGCGFVGGQICARQSITIGDRCLAGRNLVIEDYFAHPADPVWRKKQLDLYVEKMPDRTPTDTHDPLTDEELAFFAKFSFASMPPIDGENVGAIKIGNNVWLGRDVVVQKNVTIGDNCVIAQGSIVTRDIPANHVAAGVPAKPVKELVLRDFKETMDEMLERFADYQSDAQCGW